ncbi:hypothetical protein F2Q70_00008757 [Brassica cretica]|uniref:RRM domain-containing protein n=1 Tax=Brassica cretica TaxID=69181 RepID=A0A8S9LYT3_BRACR|nr:hypothetical protein F2Q70_00008757 [Brassica cretica]
MELESKESLSADMPSLLRRSAEAFNGGSEYRSATDLSIFSSSLPTLFHEKLNMTDSDSWLSLDDNSPNLNKLVMGNSEKDSLEDAEPHSLEILLPEDENELLPGLIDELNFSGLPDELEDLDVFCTGGGMELDAESQRDAAIESYWSQEFTVYFLFSLAVGDAKKMELEPKESLSADMPSFLRRSSEAFNGGSGYRSATDLSMFSSSLPTLFHEKLNMTDSDSWLSLDDNSPNLNKLVMGNSEKDSLEDAEPPSLEILLPEDENELLPGLIDELNFSGLPDELEDLDVFCTGGGMELDAESQRDAASSFVTRKRSNTSGRVSVEHPNGEHPSRTLFVRNINSSIDDSELTALFEPFGEIRSLYTACKSRGFVMISYYDIRAAHAAMRAQSILI